MDTNATTPGRNTWLLLASAIILWGLAWSALKTGLEYSTPLWFASERMVLASLTLFLILGVQGKLRLPHRQDLPVLLSVGILQMGLCISLIHSAVLWVEAGRSAILAYTTPIWIAPVSFWLIGERPSKGQLAGLVIGAVGVGVLFNPFTFNWGWNGYTLGNAMLLLFAVVWGGVIMHVRAHNWTRPHLELLPWQMSLGAGCLLSAALLIDGAPRQQMGWQLAAMLFYVGPVASAYAFWAYLTAARQLPATSTAMASMGIPVVGFVGAAVLLGEPFADITLAGLVLIVGGILLYFRSVFKKRAQRPD